MTSPFEKPPIIQGPEKAESKKEKSSLWKEAKDYVKIGALVTLISVLGILRPWERPAQELGKLAKTETKKKIEQSVETAEKSKDIIAKLIKEKGKEGVFNYRTEENGRIKEINFPTKVWSGTKGTTIVGYNKDGTEAWLMHEVAGGSFTTFDKNFDGVVDRVISNKEPLKSAEKTAINQINAFSPMEEIRETASVEYTAKTMTGHGQPAKIQVFEMSGGTFLSVDFSTGESAKLTGEKAEELKGMVQGGFNTAISETVQEIQQSK